MEEALLPPKSADHKEKIRPASKLRPNTLLSIQFLRVVAAGGVVLFHYFNDYWSQVGLLAREGVGLFFLISGFIMVKSTERSHSPTAFLRRRIARVVPLYWFLTAIWIVRPYIFSSYSTSVREGLPHIAKSLLFVPYANHEGRLQPILYVGWTLNYEMFFYAVFAAAIFCSHKYRALICSAVIVALVLTGRSLHPAGIFASFYLNDIMLHFVAGMVLASTLHQIPVEFARKFAYPSLVAAIVAYGVAVALAAWPPYHILPEIIVFVGAVTYELGRPFRRQTAVAMAGDLTYGIYLIHPLLVSLAAGVIARRFHHSYSVSLLMFPFVVVTVVLLSYLTYEYIELPSQRALFRPKAA